MSQQLMSLTPESLRTQIAKLRGDAERYRETADELEVKAKALEERLEILERGELPPDELRAKIIALAQIDGWITVPRVSRFYVAVPTHQIERAVKQLEVEGILSQNGETDHNYERGRPAQKYFLQRATRQTMELGPGIYHGGPGGPDGALRAAETVGIYTEQPTKGPRKRTRETGRAS